MFFLLTSFHHTPSCVVSAFGHKFEDRHGGALGARERSPVFVQFLDCVWQIMQQFPAAFEFNEEFLLLLADHSQSAWFGTFLFNTQWEREDHMLADRTTSIWSAVEANRPRLVSAAYNPDIDDVIVPRARFGRR